MTRFKPDFLAQLAHDFLTGIDGETFAIGRGMGLVLFVVGGLFPIAIGIWAAIVLQPPLTEWGAYLAAAAAYAVAISGASAGLIWGTKNTEPEAPKDGA